MANKKVTTAAEPAKEVLPTVTEEVTYTVGELANAAEAVFGKGTSPDLVIAALHKEGLKETTVSKAKELVNAFAKKEVK